MISSLSLLAIPHSSTRRCASVRELYTTLVMNTIWLLSKPYQSLFHLTNLGTSLIHLDQKSLGIVGTRVTALGVLSTDALVADVLGQVVDL